MTTKKRSSIYSIIRWFDAYENTNIENTQNIKKIDWLRAVPFFVLHLSVLLVFYVGWSPVAVWVAVFLYALRMFAITGFYHRYFSHKAFKTSRMMQFIFAIIGASSAQRGPLWWASHHRLHHKNSDKENDQHSPRQHGFFWSHMGWFLGKQNYSSQHDKIKDFAKYPELKFIDRFDVLVPLILGTFLYFAGEILHSFYPSLETNGLQMFVWGFVISTLALYHITFTINSLAHTIGRRRFETKDDSRNNWFLAIITFGEGWHNNHHYFPGSARQGFTWWEIDISYYVLKIFEKLGLVWELRLIPDHVQKELVNQEQ